MGNSWVVEKKASEPVDKVARREVTLYEHPNRQGAVFEFFIRDGECFQVPGYAEDIASSINTRGNCIRICEHHRCTGRCINMFPGSSGHVDFGVIGFHDILSTMIPC